jgi:protease-4
MREYPEYGNWLDDLLGKNKTGPEAVIKEQLGEENYKIFQQIARIKEMTSGVQARLPFEFMVK